MPNPKFRIQNWGLVFCLFNFAFLFASCGSVPNLEAPECTASRGAVKEFYSFHFGNEMRFSPENLKERERFLTPQLVESLRNEPADADVFTTRNTDYPKAFRIGKCETLAPDRTRLEVLLFWKTDTRTEERAIGVEAVRQGDKWMVDKILN
jgi:hypothetical protein